MNKVLLTGTLGRDVECKTSASGTPYAKFSIAVNRMAGETDWINCTCFGKTAEFAGNYLKKGTSIGVEGTLQVSTYEKDGKKTSSMSVIAERIEFVGNKKKAEEAETEAEDFSQVDIGNLFD